MLPLVCNEAQAILFMFDLTREPTLTSVKEWYKQAKSFSKLFVPILVGTKFDLFIGTSPESQASLVKKARKYAAVMKAPLVFASSRIAINVKSIFKIVLAKIFGIKPAIAEIHDPGTPILEITPYTPPEEKEEKN